MMNNKTFQIYDAQRPYFALICATLLGVLTSTLIN